MLLTGPALLNGCWHLQVLKQAEQTSKQRQVRQDIDPRQLDSTTSGGDNSQLEINTFDSLSNFEAAVAAGGQPATTFHRPKARAGETIAGSGSTKGAKNASQRRQKVSNGEPATRDVSTKRQQTREKSSSLVKKSWSQVMFYIVFIFSWEGVRCCQAHSTRHDYEIKAHERLSRLLLRCKLLRPCVPDSNDQLKLQEICRNMAWWIDNRLPAAGAFVGPREG